MCFQDTFWFNLELENYKRLHNKKYIPTLTSVDRNKLEIRFEYCDANLNHLFHNNSFPPNWEFDVCSIKNDLEKEGFYKINFYPHTFFYIDNQLKIFDLYACVKKTDKILESKVTPIINDENRFYFQNGYLDIARTYNYTIRENCGNWPTKITW